MVACHHALFLSAINCFCQQLTVLLPPLSCVIWANRSGSCIVYYLTRSRIFISEIAKKTGRSATSDSGQINQFGKTKRRMFRIAWQTGLCLLMNLGVTIWTSTALEEWSRTSAVWLRCSTIETYNSKEWDNYEVIPLGSHLYFGSPFHYFLRFQSRLLPSNDSFDSSPLFVHAKRRGFLELVYCTVCGRPRTMQQRCHRFYFRRSWMRLWLLLCRVYP